MYYSAMHDTFSSRNSCSESNALLAAFLTIVVNIAGCQCWTDAVICNIAPAGLPCALAKAAWVLLYGLAEEYQWPEPCVGCTLLELSLPSLGSLQQRICFLPQPFLT